MSILATQLSCSLFLMASRHMLLLATTTTTGIFLTGTADTLGTGEVDLSLAIREGTASTSKRLMLNTGILTRYEAIQGWLVCGCSQCSTQPQIRK